MTTIFKILILGLLCNFRYCNAYFNGNNGGRSYNGNGVYGRRTPYYYPVHNGISSTGYLATADNRYNGFQGGLAGQNGIFGIIIAVVILQYVLKLIPQFQG